MAIIKLKMAMDLAGGIVSLTYDFSDFSYVRTPGKESFSV